MADVVAGLAAAAMLPPPPSPTSEGRAPHTQRLARRQGVGPGTANHGPAQEGERRREDGRGGLPAGAAGEGEGEGEAEEAHLAGHGDPHEDARAAPPQPSNDAGSAAGWGEVPMQHSDLSPERREMPTSRPSMMQSM